jgi:hypothetical protein
MEMEMGGGYGRNRQKVEIGRLEEGKKCDQNTIIIRVKNEKGLCGWQTQYEVQSEINYEGCILVPLRKNDSMSYSSLL